MRRFALAAPVLIAALAGAALSPFASAQNAGPAGPAAWEYKVESFSDAAGRPALELQLNALGRQGWELAVAYEGGAVFKRRMH